MDETIKFGANVSEVVSFEKKTGTSLMDAFGAHMSMTNIFELVKACSNANDAMIDAYVKANGFEKLVEALTQSLVDAGFLPKVEQ